MSALNGHGQMTLPMGGINKLCVVPIEGVLLPGDPDRADLKSQPAARWARGFYGAMHAQYRMVALTFDPPTAKWWLAKEGMPDWALILGCVGFWEEWQSDVVREMLANSWEIEWYVGTDFDTLTDVQRQGINTLRPGLALQRPGFKAPDEEYTPWETVASDTLVPGP